MKSLSTSIQRQTNKIIKEILMDQKDKILDRVLEKSLKNKKINEDVLVFLSNRIVSKTIKNFK